MTDDRPAETWLDSRGRRLGDPRVLVELELRYALTDLMVGTPGRVWTVTELADAVAARGFTIPGRPGKTVSDALRTELVRGRVHRLGRGRYVAAATIPGTTRRRIRRAVRHRADLLTRSWPRVDGPGSLDP